jgi:hypothetical protein
MTGAVWEIAALVGWAPLAMTSRLAFMFGSQGFETNAGA